MMKPKHLKYSALGIVVAASLALASVPLFKKVKRTLNFDEVHAHRGPMKITVLSTGTVQPENRLEIKPPVDGRIEQLLVKEGETVKRGQVLCLVSSSERAALIDAARSEGPEEMKQWEDFYKTIPIYAPIDGMLILQNVQPGQSFAKTDAILVLSDRLTVKAQVDETDISKIQLRQRAEIVLDAYPDQPLPAIVDHKGFDSKVMNSITTYIVDVLPTKNPSFMLSGMTANVRFFISEQKNTLLLPAAAVKTRGGMPYVFVNVDGQPAQRTVQTGVSDGKDIEILSGVDETDAILIPIAPTPGSSSSGSNPLSGAK
jgi:macrolide-specific efflux system membrane fusion protein